jgi:hypothetical protein
MEHDMLGLPGASAGAQAVMELASDETFLEAQPRVAVGSFADESAQERYEEDEDCGCCDEEDPLVEIGEDKGEATCAEEEEGDATCAEEEEEVEEEGQELPATDSEGIPATTKKKSCKSLGNRLQELAKPHQPKPEAASDSPKAAKTTEKKPKTNRPSLLLRLKPTNLEEARNAFFASNFNEAPKFTYAFDDEYVTKHFQENSIVCFELMPEAKRILEKVIEEYGGHEPFMEKLYGKEKVSAEDLRDAVAEYLKEHNIEDKVEIRIVDNMLAAANVVKPGAEDKYRVNIARGQVPKTMIEGICDHEVGTHLLRMMNDEHQVWHGRRDRYKLANPCTTEEGFATINTYISMPCKLLYPQALRYWAVCRGAELGFVELFQEIRQHIPDPDCCWWMCCRTEDGQSNCTVWQPLASMACQSQPQA